MAYFYGLKLALVGLLAFGLLSNAVAALCTPLSYSANSPDGCYSFGAQKASTAVGAANACAAKQPAANKCTASAVTNTAWSLDCINAAGTVYKQAGSMSLPGGVCEQPSVTDQQACDNFALLQNSTLASRDWQATGYHSSGPACLPVPGSSSGTGCAVQFDVTLRHGYTGSPPNATGGFSEGSVSVVDNKGVVCTPSATGVDPTPPAADTCPNGQTGTVNGVQVCVPLSSGTPTSTSTGTTTQTGVNASGAPTTTTISTTTVCTGAGSCTTTTTTGVSTSGGAPVNSTTNRTESKSEFCKANPTNPQCTTGAAGGDKSSFGGSCTPGFTCSGDAIQCAMAQEQYRQNCIVNKVTPESDLYGVESVKTGSQIAANPANETKAISSSMFDSSNALGGAACIADKSVTVAGQTISLPFSQVCSALATLRLLLLSVAYIVASMIVFRGVR